MFCSNARSQELHDWYHKYKINQHVTCYYNSESTTITSERLKYFTTKRVLLTFGHSLIFSRLFHSVSPSDRSGRGVNVCNMHDSIIPGMEIDRGTRFSES